MVSRQPGEGRYSYVEREQRWLLVDIPGGANEPHQIIDHYIIGTSLRLRKVTDPSGPIFKLTQKVRADRASPEVVRITNTYITESEFNLLNVLPNNTLIKTRHHLAIGGRLFAIDKFEGRHIGLVIAELELTTDEPRAVIPFTALREVTDDDAYSGGALALATDEEICRILR